METRALGSLKVSVVGLGCNNFGMRIDEAETRRVVDAAVEAGINFFDTADVYGRTLSEQFLGKALGTRRDEVIVATKFANPLGGEAQSGASARWIVEAVEGSLQRLGTDYIDLYQQHVPDDSVPIEETLEALDRLVQAGKVRQIGNSNFSAVQIAEAATASEAHGWARFVSAQNELSLLRTSARHKVLPACVEHGLGFLPYFPLASGMLTGKYRRGEPIPEGTRLALWPEDRTAPLLAERTFDRVEALTAYAADHGGTLTELAFAWLAAQPTVASVIAGATSSEQVATNAAATGWGLTDGDLTAVDDILTAHRS
jgi:aryl-alcohol dehydrogenase-like predicted oxidoreductase